MDVLSSGERSMNAKEVASGYSTPIREATNCSEEVLRRNTFSQTVSSCKSVESGKSMPKVAREQAQLEKVRKGHGSSEPGIYQPDLMSSHTQ